MNPQITRLVGIAEKHFAIAEPTDWQTVTPASILSVKGLGPKTLNALRLHLAGQGLTLQYDASPAFWQQKITGLDTITAGFTIAIDKAEQHPWTFQGLTRDGSAMVVPIGKKSLGPTHGDYTVYGLEGLVHIERSRWATRSERS